MAHDNKEFLVTVKVCFTKKYLVSAADWEYAEDYGVDEAYGDVYNIHSDECTVQPMDAEAV